MSDIYIPGPQHVTDACLQKLASVFKKVANGLLARDINPENTFRSPTRFLILPSKAIAGLLNGTCDFRHAAFDALQRQQIEDYIARQYVLHQTYSRDSNLRKVAYDQWLNYTDPYQIISEKVHSILDIALCSDYSPAQIVEALVQKDLVNTTARKQSAQMVA